MDTKFVALDIETTGLDFNRDTVTVVATHTEAGTTVYRNWALLSKDVSNLIAEGFRFVGHNFKFDLKFLNKLGISIPHHLVEDTHLMSVAYTKKIPENWLDLYEMERKKRNKDLPTGVEHRKAKGESLKTLAPYFLGVEPFWETPGNYDNDEYVGKDAEYTYQLAAYFSEHLNNDEYSFYKKRLLPWSELILGMEQRGITLDRSLMDEMWHKTKIDAAASASRLNDMWDDDIKAYHQMMVDELDIGYLEKFNKAASKKPYTYEQRGKLVLRYAKLKEAAIPKIEPFNMDSPEQIKWLLKERRHLNIEKRVRDKDTGEITIEESSSAEVLERLARQGNPDCQEILNYRSLNKLLTSFYPTYQELVYQGNIHSSFNIGGTRTGRLSSSDPNLQQVPGDLHKLFKARPGYKLVCYDQSAVEARLLAYYSKCPILKDICESGQSIHDYNTKYVFFDLDTPLSEIKAKHPAERRVSKEVGFAGFYGAGWRRIQSSALVFGFEWSDRECKDIHERMKELYATVFEYKKEVVDPSFMRKEPIKNLLGRPLVIDNPEDVYMKGFNTLIQGGASDLVLHGAWRAQQEYRKMGIEGHVLLLVHDEIVAEIREDQVEEGAAILRHCMTDFDLSPIKLEVEGQISDYWTK